MLVKMVLTVFVKEFILYMFLEKLLYTSTDLFFLFRDVVVVLSVVPLRYTCQEKSYQPCIAKVKSRNCVPSEKPEIWFPWDFL